MSYYVFDLQNEADVLNGKKPEVKQRGPYTYKEMRENIPVLWEDGGNLLTYLENKTYIFDQEKSCSDCTEQDNITTPNIVALVRTFDVINVHLSQPLLSNCSSLQMFVNHLCCQNLQCKNEEFFMI